MGIALDNTSTKTKDYDIDEAWAINIQSAINDQSPVGDPKVTVHRREGTYYTDKSFSKSEKPTEGYVEKHSFTMSEIVARTGTLAYKDKTGVAKTVPMSDAPLIVKALVDALGSEARQAKLDALSTEEENAEES